MLMCCVGPVLHVMCADQWPAVTTGTLHLLQLTDAPWIKLNQQEQQQRPRSSVLEQCMQQQAIVFISDLPVRSRRLQHAVTNQLAVSRSRGLASLVTDMQHLLLVDLEDDEDQDQDEDDEDADADADQMDE